MKLFRTLSTAAALSVLLGTHASVTAQQLYADTIVINADVRTSDAAKPRADAFAVRAGRFLAVGSTNYIESLRGPGTKVVDAGGKTVTPGLVDAHTHLILGTDLERGVDLEGLNTQAEWLKAISDAAAKVPKGQWLAGGRWNPTKMEGGAMPTLKALDAITPNVPVALVDMDYHSLWINSRAMKILGIDEHTRSPPGGEIVRDKNGQMTGVLKETAQQLILDNKLYKQVIPAREDSLRKIFKRFNAMGVTSVHDMINGDFSVYKNMLGQGKFPMRVWFGFLAPTDEESTGAAVFDTYKQTRIELDELSIAKEQEWKSGPQFRYGYIKYFVDGTIANYTAALHAPYSDRHDHFKGAPIVNQERLNQMVSAAHVAGFPVSIHAIGDRGVEMALDAFAASEHKPTLPDRIEHVELLDAKSLPRFARENVVASMQPEHGIDGDWQGSRLGNERLPLAYAWQPLLSSGATVVLGSDWPTARPDPMLILGNAVLREKNGKPWFTENALSFDEALYAYTQAPANLSGWGEEIGSVTVGKWADFVMLQDRVSEPAQDIRGWQIDQTWFAGEQVYRRAVN